MCKDLDDEFLEIARSQNLKAGSTLCLTVVQNGNFHVANIGDSCAYRIKQNGKLMKLTDEQTPNRADEYNRIINNCGLVTVKNDVVRVDGSIAVSRAIGDLKYK